MTRTDDRCARCDLVWLDAVAADPARAERSLFTGVMTASVTRRLLAGLVDLLVLAATVAPGGYLIGTGGLGTERNQGWLLIVAGALTLLVQGCVLLKTGRSVGRLLLGLRTVDDLTAAPLGLAGLLQVVAAGQARPRFVTADLRRGRDPEQVADLAAPLPVVPAVSPSTDATQPARRRSRTRDETPAPKRLADEPGREPGPEPGGEPADESVASDLTDSDLVEPVAASLAAFSTGHRGAQPSVGIRTDGGDSYEVEQVLLIGRSPVDPHPGPGRMVLAWPDLSRRLAKTHLMLEWSGTVLWVTDLESLTGTSVSTPDGSRVTLAPGVRFAAGIGSVISCGGRSITVVPHV